MYVFRCFQLGKRLIFLSSNASAITYTFASFGMCGPYVFFGFFFASKLNSTDRFRKLKIHLGFFDHGMCYTHHSEELCFITIAQHSTWVSE